MILLGIDPGLSGAIARFDSGTGDLTVFDIPTFELKRGGKKKREIDAAQLVNLMTAFQAEGTQLFLEQVGSMPGQGVSSVFSFGKTYGILIGIASALCFPLTFVAPVTWKKKLGVPAAKDGARARASQLLPRHAALWPLVKHDGRAEAALIALYGSYQLGTRT